MTLISDVCNVLGRNAVCVVLDPLIIQEKLLYFHILITVYDVVCQKMTKYFQWNVPGDSLQLVTPWTCTKLKTRQKCASKVYRNETDPVQYETLYSRFWNFLSGNPTIVVKYGKCLHNIQLVPFLLKLIALNCKSRKRVNISWISLIALTWTVFIQLALW